MKKLSIVVPCYNESKNIPLIVTSFKKAVAKRKDVEVILVNNGSTDDSVQSFEQALKSDESGLFKVVNVVKNQGYGFGILSGLEASTGDVLSWTHADMQTDPGDVIRAFETYLAADNEQILIKGKRRNRAFIENATTFGMQVVANLALGVFLDDINAQPKVFSRNFYEKFLRNQSPHDFSLDLFALYQAKKNRFQIKTIPVFFNKRMHGEAKGGGGSLRNKIKLIRRTWAYIFKLKASHKL